MQVISPKSVKNVNKSNYLLINARKKSINHMYATVFNGFECLIFF